ncbi:MAG: hypothetical protein GY722_23665 [bacterium]|nr:hypothetical protein [bacterium]
MNSRHLWKLIVVLLVTADGPYAALAGDIQVNTYTTGGQYFPSVALDPTGDFVVVWMSDGSSGTDTSAGSIQGQRFAANGDTVAGEFQVNTYTTSHQSDPAVAVDWDGNFVVVSYSDGSSGTDRDWSIQGQRYAADGSPLGAEFQVNTYTTGAQLFPAPAAGRDGDFVVVWQSDGSSGTDTSDASIQGQRYAADGSAVGAEFQVNTYTTGPQQSASVAMAADGSFIVVWQNAPTIARRDIQGQRYAADGSPVSGEFQVNTYTTDDQRDPSVAQNADGSFVVVWRSHGSAGTDSSLYSIQGQRCAADGSPVSGEVQVNTYTTGRQTHPSVAVAGEGDFVVVWTSLGSSGTDDSRSSIQGQRFAADGSTIGGEFQVNTITTDDQRNPSVSTNGLGNFVVVWDSESSGGTDTDHSSIQRSPVPLVFADGFESGDTTAWSEVHSSRSWVADRPTDRIVRTPPVARRMRPTKGARG